MASDNFPHDAAYKAFFSNPDMVKSLLLDFVPKDFIKDFDLDTLEKYSGSYTTTDLRERFDDIVWRVRWKDTWCYIYILLEFQSTQDNWMALRVAIYTGLLWESLIKNGLVKTGDKLPPVLPIVIYNGEKPWKAPKNVADLVTPIHSGLAKFQLSQEYFLLDESQLSQILLDNAKGEAGYLFRFERAEDAESIMSIYREFMSRISGKKFDFLRRSIKIWLILLMRKKNILMPSTNDEPDEDNVMLEQKFRQWEQEFIERGKEEGLAKGLEAGIAKGLAEGLTNQRMTLIEMLSDRFGTIPLSWKETISCMNDPSTISQLTRAILKTGSVEEFDSLLSQKISFQ